MATTSDIDYLDGEFTVQENEPSTLAEVVEIIGEQATVDEAVSNLRYRNKYPRVYGKVSAAIAGTFPRAIKSSTTKADGTVKNVLVSPNDHLRAFLATGEEARATLASLFTSIAQSEPLYVKGERTGGGGKVAQATLDAANGFFAAGQEDDIAAKIESMVPGYKCGRDAENNLTVESLARGIQALERHLAKQAPKALDALK
jgi:hypothetical protein